MPVSAVDPIAAPVIVCLPAMGVSARFYRGFADALAAATGATVDTVDLRGQGSHPERARSGASFGYREIVEQDIPACVAGWRARHPGRPVVLLGHSLGGQLALLACAQRTARADALVLVAAGTAHWRAWPAPQRVRARCTVQAIRAAAAVLPWYPGGRLGFGGDQPRRLMRDWGFNATTGRYRLEGSARSTEAIEAALREVTMPLLAVEVPGDAVAPSGALDALLALVPHARATRRVVPVPHGQSPWRRHFGWARAPAPVVSEIVPWLHEHVAPSGARPPAPRQTEGEPHVLA